jgi:hypothetical protein
MKILIIILIIITISIVISILNNLLISSMMDKDYRIEIGPKGSGNGRAIIGMPTFISTLIPIVNIFTLIIFICWKISLMDTKKLFKYLYKK